LALEGSPLGVKPASGSGVGGDGAVGDEFAPQPTTANNKKTARSGRVFMGWPASGCLTV
jgi:hypothetical protein